ERAAHVGEQADPRLRHPDLRGLRDDPVGAVDGDAHTAAHRDAVHDRDVRLGVVGDVVVHAVLVRPEVDGFVRALDDAAVDGLDVTAGAESAVAAARHEDGPHRVIVLPRGE